MANTCKGTIGDSSFTINRLTWSYTFNLTDSLVSPACSGVIGVKNIPLQIHKAWEKGWGAIPDMTVVVTKRRQETIMLFENIGLINKIFDGGLWKFRFLASKILIL